MKQVYLTSEAAPRPRRRPLRHAPALLLTLAAGCADRAPPDGRAAGPTDDRDAVRGELLVSAASSLTEAFGELAAGFEAAHPGVEVTLNLAGSATLAAQILEGAPVDVFASADLRNVERLAEAGLLAAAPTPFARNALRIAVPAGNPARVRGIRDLAREELVVGLCARGVPCGELARTVLARAGVRVSPSTEEPNVRSLLTRVELGELDAALVYATDVRAAGGAVEGVGLGPAGEVATEYPAAVLADAPNPRAGRAFVAFLTSPDARRILARHGFLPP